jgi:regulator of sigma E protease
MLVYSYLVKLEVVVLTLMTWMSSFLHSVFAFVIILVPLVVFHEFGHFVFAKLFGVKAEIFSVGFGPRLWGKQMGETEFRLSAIPMGGYVKLLGEDREAEVSPEEQKRALHRQAPWKRFFIFVGGPLFNFILAIFIFMVILVVGEPQLASVVGRVVQGSVAEQAGFRSGDRIVAVAGKPVKKFEEIGQALNENPNKKLVFQVLHPQATVPIDLEVLTSSQLGMSMYGESVPVGEVDGLLPIGRATQVGISDPHSTVGKLGLETGDRIVSFDSQPVNSWEELEAGYSKFEPGRKISLEYKKAKNFDPKAPPKAIDIQKVVGSKGLGEDFGLYSSELFVEKPVPGSPAELAGVRPGDRLISVGGRVVQSFFDLKSAVQKSGETEGKVSLKWERSGQVFGAVLSPTVTLGRDPLLNKTTVFTVGVVPMLVLAEPATYIERVLNPFKLVYQATNRMITFSWRNLVLLRKMAVGEVSVGNLGGPLMIGKIAGESMTRGLVAFLTNMAIFSVGLGVLNILPIPVLDGGHLLLLGVESIRGKPLTMKQMEIVQSIGFLFILALMGVAFRNDIARLLYL